jgi:hypothetical protein
MIRIRGVGRVGDEPRSVLVCLTDIPSDHWIRSFHDAVRDWHHLSPPPASGCDVVLYEAAKALADFYRRSLDVGPLNKSPSREAMMWRNLRAALSAFEEENTVIS